MSRINCLGWTGNIFLIIGTFLIGERSPNAFLLVFIGEALWLIKSIKLRAWDMITLCVVFGALAMVNYWKWS
jgi:hypothetical protein